MKRLLILRHAKSCWDDPTLTDFNRPLNKRGRRAAARMGIWITENGLEPDTIICSTARRAQQTLEFVTDTNQWNSDCIHTDDLYLAPSQIYLHYLTQLPEHIRSAMVIGHNPGIEQLVHLLGGEYHSMPTCALAILDFDIESWEVMFTDKVAGQLQHHILARDLD